MSVSDSRCYGIKMKTEEIRKFNDQTRYFKKGHTFRWNKSIKIVVSTAKKW
ncbi:hypothetical protein RV07_GL002413 [Enterococcus malodoratus]|nr:hypothetical protein RV07_GL002413 [Enterococcus malodoratus]